MIQSITFGDKNTWDDWHLLPVSRPVFAPPTVKTSYIDIPGGNGSLDLSESLTKYPVFNNRTGSFTFRAMNGYGNWADRYSDIMDYLHGKNMRAILADDDQWFYQGRFTVDGDGWKPGNTWSEITICYNVSPFKWSLFSSTEDWLWDPFNFDTGLILDTVFSNMDVDSSKQSVYKFESYMFGTVPVSPTVYVYSAGSSGMNITFKNSYLGINQTIHFNNDETKFVPDMIFYGQNEAYELVFDGKGYVSIDFRRGRL